MINEIDKSIPIPRKHRAGERASADKMNDPGRAIERMVTGVTGPVQIAPQRRSLGGGHERMIVQSVEPDYLVCRTYHDGVAGTEDRNIAKPELLRRTPFESGGDLEEFNDRTYTYIGEDGTTRVVEDADGHKDFEQIDPPWLPDCPLTATGPIEGGTGVTVGGEDLLQQDAGCDGRRWMPFAMGGFVCAGMVGGSTAIQNVSNFLHGAWVAKQPVPLPRRGQTAGFTLGNLGYLAGGQTYQTGGASSDTILQIYRRETWSTGNAMLAPGHHRHAGAAAGNRGYVWGGRAPHPQESKKHLDQFNPDTSAWTTQHAHWDYKYGVGDHCGIGIGDRLYSFGGERASQPGGTAWTWMFDPIADVNRWIGQNDSGTSPDRVFATAAAAGGKAYLMGGYDSGNLGDCQRFDPAGSGGSWYSMAGFSDVEYGHDERKEVMSFSLSNEVYLIGGHSVETGYLTDVLKLDPAGVGTWSVGSALPTPARSWGATFTIPDENI